MSFRAFGYRCTGCKNVLRDEEPRCGDGREILLKHAREALPQKPRTRGVCSCRLFADGRIERTMGTRCLETHGIGHGPPGSNAFSDEDPLWDYHYSLYALWDVHEKKYVEVYALFDPPPCDVARRVDLSEVLA